jgi:uncharacterized protein
MRTYNKYKAMGVSLATLAVAFGAYCAHAGGGGEDQPVATLGGVPQFESAARPGGAAPLGADQQAGAAETPSARPDTAQGMERSPRDGKIQSILMQLEAEAKRGVFNSQLRLARIYGQGRETPRNDAKAFFYYRQIADQNADIDISHPAARFVAEAFRALAGYYRSGVPVLNLAPDPARESQLLQQGASYFQDPIAQFRLAKMYLTGDGVARNPKIGVHWLVNASRRRYAPAQAVLGDLLWDGKGVRSSPGEGLALLVLAKDNAASEDVSWIGALCDKARSEANEAQVKAAERVLAKFEKVYRLKAGGGLQIKRPNQPGPDAPNPQTDGLPPDEALEAGALLGLFGGEDLPTTAPGAPVELDRLPILGPAGNQPQGMITSFTYSRSGGVSPAKAVAPAGAE